MIFFTSDLHLNHSKIIDFDNLPFDNVEEMNDTVIINWNNKIKTSDTTYILGDFVFGKPEPFLKRLNGNKILIKGNHDRYSNSKAISMGFKEVYDLVNIKIDNQNIVLCHYPMYSWYKSHYGSWHLHGHVHSTVIDFNPLRYNVYIYTNNVQPLSFPEIKKIITNQKL